MSLLKKWFATDKKSAQHQSPTSDVPETFWIPLTSMDQMDTWNEEQENPIYVFKHSTSCGVSRMVLKDITQRLTSQRGPGTYFLLHLIENRAISNEIAARFGVVHQSPQFLKIEQGKCSLHEAHYSILDHSWSS
ncbi:MAG: bacillithiol system redox-active protein YtxJ [Flavobacteriaceae bacterium]